MTFKEWLATGRDVTAEQLSNYGDFGGLGGREYEAAFILKDGDRWTVVLPTTETAFADLDEAEAYLWREWAQGELED